MPDSAERAASRYRRSIVTEEALHVSPDALGLPLAGPWRRLAAILLDALLVSILANSFGVFFAFAAAYVLFRVSFRPTAGGGYLKRSFRFMFRVGGAVMLFVAVFVLWGAIRDRFAAGGDDDEGRTVRAAISVDDSGNVTRELDLSGMQAVQFGAEVIALATATNEADARSSAQEALESMRAGGLSGAEARAELRELAEGVEDRPWLAAAVEEVLRADEAAERAAMAGADTAGASPGPDSLVVAYAAAISAADSAAIDSLRPRLVAGLAADTVAVLTGAITALDGERAQLDERVTELQEELDQGPGVLALLRSFTEDLGLGLGWFGLYFTATTAMWQGRTPGKRLFGIRVIRLTGKPIGWWASFERFGGYAAGFATGLLGFMQILWDDNRQATHDKIAGTAVILDRPARSS